MYRRICLRDVHTVMLYRAIRTCSRSVASLFAPELLIIDGLALSPLCAPGVNNSDSAEQSCGVCLRSSQLAAGGTGANMSSVTESAQG